MNADDSLNMYMDKAVKHYSSLFTLPSYMKSLLFSALVCIIAGLIHVSFLYRSLLGLVCGLLLGVVLFSVTVLLNYFLRFYVFKRDPVYDLRRLAFLSLFCWILWLFFIFVGGVAAVLFDVMWAVRLCLLGFSVVLILRLIVLYVTSSSGTGRFLAASLVHPLACLVSFTPFWISVVDMFKIVVFVLYASGVSLASSFLFITILNSVGKGEVGFPSLSIFRAFLLNWIADLNMPLESFLEMLGTETNVNVSVLRFKGGDNVFILVPSVHPGPFRNIGSSLLPSLLKDGVEQKLGGVACVPLGLLGHEHDLASHNECQKIVGWVVKSAADIEANEERTTPFVKVQNDLATVCCQTFGETVLITFSLAPKTTEDFPPELGSIVREKAEKLGFKRCICVNAHNSINGAVGLQRALGALEDAAMLCLERAALLDKLPFKVGGATLKPKEFSVVDGMGHGGITAVVVEVGGRKNAYVVFDGNNMVSGLREKILSALKPMGIDDGEVLTTDTHSVNAVTLNARGYHPIGEVMNHDKLIEYVNKAVQAAIANLSPARVGFRCVEIPKVKAIGKEALARLCMLPDKVIRRAKIAAVPLFAATFLVLMAVLLWV